MLRVRFHGRGGQGVKTASRILGTAAFLEGYHAQDFPIYGPERRGAPVVAFTRISSAPISEKGYIGNPDLVVVADETLVGDSSASPLKGVDGDTLVFVNALSTEETARKAVTYDVTDAAIRILGKPSISAGVAACASKLTGLVRKAALLESARIELGKIGLEEEKIDANLKLAVECYDAISSAAFGKMERTEDQFEVRRIRAVSVLGLPTIQAIGNTTLISTGNWRLSKPVIDYAKCTNCFVCFVYCPEGCISLDEDNTPHIDYSYCKGCSICFTECPPKAISLEREVRTW